ncbi:MAG: DEAD/DEAH box helicase, partial [Acidimicrobiia bacterium]|nr:DEAD/DEAH box helicase [Acidimicrobiia bacterium]
PRRGVLGSTPSPSLAGRWYPVSSLLSGQRPSDEERALARVQTLLDRYGVVVRDLVRNEGIPGGFSALYPALAGLEDVGTVRRGYFVEGLGGAQFAVPGAVDRLRDSSPDGFTILSVTDPANCFGSVLPWPESGTAVTRRAGARVAIVDGSLVAWMDPSGKRAAVFTDDPTIATEALFALSARHRASTLAEIDGGHAHEHPLAPDLVASGFVRGYKGFTIESANHPQRNPR